LHFWSFSSKNRNSCGSSCRRFIGASILSISGKVDIAEWPIGTRTILEIGIGTVIGTSLTKDSMVDLQSLWRPAIL